MKVIQLITTVITFLTLTFAAIRRTWKNRQGIQARLTPGSIWIERHVALCLLVCILVELITAGEILLLVAR